VKILHKIILIKLQAFFENLENYILLIHNAGASQKPKGLQPGKAEPSSKTYKVCSPALAAPQDLIGLAEGIQIHKIRFR